MLLQTDAGQKGVQVLDSQAGALARARRGGSGGSEEDAEDAEQEEVEEEEEEEATPTVKRRKVTARA